MKAFLAVDWGTTNLRAWRVAATGDIEASRELPLGVSQIPRGEAQHVFEREIRPTMHAEHLPALLCGMIGSDLGWRTAPYVACPAGLAELANGVLHVGAPGAPSLIIPGLKCDGVTGAPDVMRGEETQLIGWAALNPEKTKGRHLVCHPGTHAKWALMQDGYIVRFITAMTGELFDVLSKHSVLRNISREDDQAFRAGLAAADEGDALAARLFSARARVTAGGADPATTSSYLSGLLIGAEVAALPRYFPEIAEASICVLGAPSLRRHYATALRQRGHPVWEIDGADAAIAGFLALARQGVLDDAG